MGTKRVGHARIRALINENNNLMSIRKPRYVSGTATSTLTAEQSGRTVLVGGAAAGLAADTVFTLPGSLPEPMQISSSAVSFSTILVVKMVQSIIRMETPTPHATFSPPMVGLKLRFGAMAQTGLSAGS